MNTIVHLESHIGPHYQVQTCADLQESRWKRHACDLRKLRIWPIPVDVLAGLDKFLGLKRSSTIEINALFGSMKSGLKGAPQNAV